jgi:hypothetical protein
VFCVRAADISLPLVAFVPFHPPEAVHEVAFVLDQVSIVVAPLLIEFGDTDNDTEGTAMPPPGFGLSPPPLPHAATISVTTNNTRWRSNRFGKLIDKSVLDYKGRAAGSRRCGIARTLVRHALKNCGPSRKHIEINLAAKNLEAMQRLRAGSKARSRCS